MAVIPFQVQPPRPSYPAAPVPGDVPQFPAAQMGQSDLASRLFGVTGVNVNPYMAAPTQQQGPMVLWGYESVSAPGGTIPLRDPQGNLIGFQPRRMPGLRGGREGVVPRPPQPFKVRNPQWLTLDEAIADIYTWKSAKLTQLGDRLVASGRLDPDYTREELFTQWSELVTRAAATAQTGNPLSPWDILEWWGGDPSRTGAGQPRTTTRRDIRLSTADEARAILRTMLSGAIGRPASEKEVDDFQSMLNAQQRQNPVVVTSQYSAEGDLTSQTSKGGVVAEEVAQDFLKDELGDEWRRYSLLAQIMPTLEQAIASPV